MIINKLKSGDEIRIVAPSTSLAKMRPEFIEESIRYLTKQGFIVTFSKNCREIDEMDSSSIRSRVEDLHEAFRDSNVKAILAANGGFNVNQILAEIDYSIIKVNPKIICGFSDITALLNAIYAKTGLITYHGPNFFSFGLEEGREYLNQYFWNAVGKKETYLIETSDKKSPYITIQAGSCQGEIIGGNLCTLNLLQGTEYMPNMENKILFLEDDNIVGDYFSYEFDRNLQSLIQTTGFSSIRGIVFGRFEENCKLNAQSIKKIVNSKKQLKNIPIVFNVNFGHIEHAVTFPIGGVACLEANENNISLKISKY
jgi:muramoyltetrapeptide carboxypeptidase